MLQGESMYTIQTLYLYLLFALLSVDFLSANSEFILCEDHWHSSSPYSNNTSLNIPICIDYHADQMIVTIEGRTQKSNDFIIVSDWYGNKISKLSGDINISLVIDDSWCNIYFESDNKVSDKGFSIHATQYRP